MNNTISVARFFPDRQAALISQTGTRLSNLHLGVEVILHFRAADRIPVCAEVICENLHTEIGLWFSGRELTDFDGAFTLPREVSEMLRDEGIEVAEDFFS
jgi:hypothetical protein